MMGWFLDRNLSPIGLDIGRRCIKAVQLARVKNGWRIAAAAVLERKTDEAMLSSAEAERLCDVLHRQGFRGVDVVIAAPGRALRAEVLELPPRDSEAPLEQIARSELARTGKLEAEAFEMAMWDLPPSARDKGATVAMGVALRHIDADPMVDVLEGQGLTVRALDCQSWAMARACAPQMLPEGTTGLLDLGWTSSLLVVVHKGVVIYQRVVSESGLGELRTAIAKKLEVDTEAGEYLMQKIGLNEKPGEAVAQADPADVRAVNTLIARHMDMTATELQVPLSYASHRYPDAAVEKVLVMGGGAAVPGCCERLGAMLSVPTKPVVPADLAICPPEFAERCGTPLLTTALGLARHKED